MQKVYLAVDDNNHIVGFQRLTLDDANKAEKLTTVIDLYRKWRQDLCSTRVTDIRIRPVPNDPRRFFVGCKIDGEQQLRRELNPRDARIWKEHLDDLKKYGKNPHDMAYHKMLEQSLTVQYYQNDILNDRSQSQELKR